MRTLLLCGLLVSASTAAQTYQPNWESLDKRPVPQWFNESRFGIFIHWGAYSVPAYSTKGSYAEWYQQGLESGDSAKRAYHKNKYGDLSYYQLADQFKAELFNPDEWAKLIERSGAKYIVLTSKHHDGYALWPSKEASRTWGFPWNAKEVGPKRDLLGDLFRAVRKTTVRAGMYYSLYEWYNPLWKTDRKKYATEHMWPQMKELINTYQPDVFWTDGDWDASDEVWKSKEFLAWLYNESPVKEKIVTYDRWGSGIRFKHGAVFTPEYQPNADFEDHAWEESRGMGHSYGYNREEDAWDYNSTVSLVIALVDKVSRGGNFLLDIGPDEHGKIPPIMQERLLQIGDWLRVNGESIYGAGRWQTVAQWTAGKRDYKTKHDEDPMLKLTIDPEPGYASKEVFYTYNEKTNALYAIFPRYPSDGKLVLRGLKNASSINSAGLLGIESRLPVAHVKGDVVISLPAYDPNRMKAPYAYVVKLNGYGKYLHKPRVAMVYNDDLSGATVTLTAHAGEETASIHYSVNGGAAQRYSAPVKLKPGAVLTAYAVKEGNIASDTVSVTALDLPLQKATAVAAPQKGLRYRYYESDHMSMDVFRETKPVAEGIAEQATQAVKRRKDKYGLVFEGYVYVEKTAGYSFYTDSDDGSVLEVDGKTVVDNDGNHSFAEKEGKVFLEKGYHRIRLRYFDSGGDNKLLFSYNLFGEPKREVPAAQLFQP